ncbi:MAG: hypothetical protein NTY47_09030, partial [Candidatus Omnitrophica bacterium]|nr:hypothetical protein [Candidatus Omnitrophota bacterium]
TAVIDWLKAEKAAGKSDINEMLAGLHQFRADVAKAQEELANEEGNKGFNSQAREKALNKVYTAREKAGVEKNTYSDMIINNIKTDWTGRQKYAQDLAKLEGQENKISGRLNSLAATAKERRLTKAEEEDQAGLLKDLGRKMTEIGHALSLLGQTTCDASDAKSTTTVQEQMTPEAAAQDQLTISRTEIDKAETIIHGANYGGKTTPELAALLTSLNLVPYADAAKYPIHLAYGDLKYFYYAQADKLQATDLKAAKGYYYLGWAYEIMSGIEEQKDVLQVGADKKLKIYDANIEFGKKRTAITEDGYKQLDNLRNKVELDLGKEDKTYKHLKELVDSYLEQTQKSKDWTDKVLRAKAEHKRRATQARRSSGQHKQSSNKGNTQATAKTAADATLASAKATQEEQKAWENVLAPKLEKKFSEPKADEVLPKEPVTLSLRPTSPREEEPGISLKPKAAGISVGAGVSFDHTVKENPVQAQAVREPTPVIPAVQPAIVLANIQPAKLIVDRVMPQQLRQVPLTLKPLPMDLPAIPVPVIAAAPAIVIAQPAAQANQTEEEQARKLFLKGREAEKKLDYRTARDAYARASGVLAVNDFGTAQDMLSGAGVMQDKLLGVTPAADKAGVRQEFDIAKFDALWASHPFDPNTPNWGF